MMSNWKFFIARRIYRSREGEKVSKPAVRIAMAGIAIGLAVMIVSVAVVIGFKHQVRDKVIGMGSDIVVSSIEGAARLPDESGGSKRQLVVGDTEYSQVSHVQRYATKPGMIMTADNFQGMIVKGVAQEYDWTYLKAHLQEGEIPALTDSVASNRVLVSRSMADKLSLKVGDKLYTYYIEGNVRARRLTVSGIFQTNFSAFDDYFLITDMYMVRRLNGWEPDQVGGVEVAVSDYRFLDSVNDDIRGHIQEQTDRYGAIYCSRTSEELYPQIFAWLDLLDTDVWVILILMTGVAGFTVISGLLIIILERTQMIGVLKALGANNASIQSDIPVIFCFPYRKGNVLGKCHRTVVLSYSVFFRTD